MLLPSYPSPKVCEQVTLVTCLDVRLSKYRENVLKENRRLFGNGVMWREVKMCEIGDEVR